jgi:predicted HAD superfamily Cof-like phosphohydrolase
MWRICQEMERLTNFQKVQEFNRAFDMVNGDEPAEYCQVITDMLGRASVNHFSHVRRNVAPEVVALRVDLITEEINELVAAMAVDDEKEIRDACADILYVTYGMGDVLGLPMDQLYYKHMLSEYLRHNQSSDELKFVQILIANRVKTNADITQVLTPYLAPEWWRNVLLYQEKLTYDRNDISDNIEDVAMVLCQLLRAVYSLNQKRGHNPDADFAIVHASNMSKLCRDEQEAQRTVADYAAKYAAGTSPYDSPYYYYLPKIAKYIVKNKSTGKALKNINYQAVQFS